MGEREYRALLRNVTERKVRCNISDATGGAFGEGVEDPEEVKISVLLSFLIIGLFMTRLPRDKTLFWTHVGVACVLGAFCGMRPFEPLTLPTHKLFNSGGLYFNTNTTIAGFQSRIGCLFFLVGTAIILHSQCRADFYPIPRVLSSLSRH